LIKGGTVFPHKGMGYKRKGKVSTGDSKRDSSSSREGVHRLGTGEVGGKKANRPESVLLMGGVLKKSGKWANAEKRPKPQ